MSGQETPVRVPAPMPAHRHVGIRPYIPGLRVVRVGFWDRVREWWT